MTKKQQRYEAELKYEQDFNKFKVIQVLKYFAVDPILDDTVELEYSEIFELINLKEFDKLKKFDIEYLQCLIEKISGSKYHLWNLE